MDLEIRAARPEEMEEFRRVASTALAIPAEWLLVFDQISASGAARMGRLKVIDPGALSAWDKTMRTIYKPSCADLF